MVKSQESFKQQCRYYVWRPGEALLIYSAFLLSIAAWVFPDQRVTAMLTTLGITVTMLGLDFQGIVTMRGIVAWGRISYGSVFIFAFVMTVCFPALLLVYFLIASADYRIMRRESERIVLRRAFAQRIVDVATLHKLDSKKRA